MLLLREGLPGWLTRAEQLLEARPTRRTSEQPTFATPLAQDLVAPVFDELVQVLSSLLLSTTREVQHEC